MELAKSIKKGDKLWSQAKAKKPDTFNGSDPCKLNNFILQCHLYFWNNPYSFSDDSAKINLALFYLWDTALKFFKPVILGENENPIWLHSWKLFITELKSNFRPIDSESNAEDTIDHLVMKDSHKILAYNVAFTCLST